MDAAHFSSPFWKPPFILYLSMIGFVTLGDAIMSYIAPVLLQDIVGTTTKMGLILATSSVAGICADFLFARVGDGKNSLFFNKIFIALLPLFPLCFLVFHSVIPLILAMVIWGVYFEAIVFSNYHFIHEHIHARHHAQAWGVLIMVKSLGWFLGPLIASTTDSLSRIFPVYLAFASFLIAILLFAVRYFFFRGRNHVPIEIEKEPVLLKRSFREEVVIWLGYGRTLWPLLLLYFLVLMVEAVFFTIGPVFAESLKPLHPFGGLFVTLYTVPSLIVGLFIAKIARPFGKKRATFAAGILAGSGLILMSMMSNLSLLLLFAFIAAVGQAIMYPELQAIFEDYVARAGRFGNDLIGLSAIIPSVAYVLGPITSGFLADTLGYLPLFSLSGIALLVVSLLCFLLVGRKIRLPNAKVAEAVSQLSET